MKKTALGILLLSTLIATPAIAATNLIVNGSFETGDFAGFQHRNSNVSDKTPAVVIAYNQTGTYPTGAYGEAVPTADSMSSSPDAAGRYAAYFVSDYAVNETLEQITQLTPGNYDVGFSAYLPHNGFGNPVDSSFTAEIAGVAVTSFTVGTQSPGVWTNYKSVAQINKAGAYDTQFVFNSNGYPAKDVIIDQIYVVRTSEPAAAIIPPVPEPATWAMMLVGMGVIGFAARRRHTVRVSYT